MAMPESSATCSDKESVVTAQAIDPSFVDSLLASLNHALEKILLYQEGMNDAGMNLLLSAVSERLADLSDLGEEPVQRGIALVADAKERGANV